VSRIDVSESISSDPSADTALFSGDQLQATGEATFAYQINRTWTTNVSFRRSLEYVPELSAPVMADGFAAGLQGMFTRRLDFSGGVGYSSGASAMNRNQSQFDTYTGAGRVRFAFTPRLAAYLEYVYYYYDFSGATSLAPGLPPTLERNGIRGGLTVLLPAVGR
jgi:hypothetical protein